MARDISANWGKMLFLAMAVSIAAGPQAASAAQSAADVYAECRAAHLALEQHWAEHGCRF